MSGALHSTNVPHKRGLKKKGSNYLRNQTFAFLSLLFCFCLFVFRALKLTGIGILCPFVSRKQIQTPKSTMTLPLLYNSRKKENLTMKFRDLVMRTDGSEAANQRRQKTRPQAPRSRSAGQDRWEPPCQGMRPLDQVRGLSLNQCGFQLWFHTTPGGLQDSQRMATLQSSQFKEG